MPMPMIGKLIDRIPQLFYHQQNRYAQEHSHSSSPHYPRQPGHQMQILVNGYIYYTRVNNNPMKSIKAYLLGLWKRVRLVVSLSIR